MAENETLQELNPGELVGLVAEFESPEALKAAGRQLRDAGYKRLEAFVPFPVHGLDDALGIRPTRLPWIVLGAGFSGAGIAVLLQWWTNAVDYPFVISGKPLFSLPANIPVTFELTILLSAFAAFFGMLIMNGLPRLAQPALRKPRFLRATSDRFFLMVEAADPKFSLDETRSALSATKPVDIDVHHDTTRAARLPRVVVPVLIVLSIIALLPPLWIAKARMSQSSQPRWHTFIDMDYQPKFKPQTVTNVFADGRADRKPVVGTVARGQLRDEDPLYRGIAAGSGPIDRTADPKTVPWLTEIPVPVTAPVMERGRERYGVYCAVCHGYAGDGDGLVNRRAMELQQGTWIPAANLHSDALRERPVGYLFDAITNGVGKMPAYGSQIDVQDRWAIVLYLRALQRSQNASTDDVPPEILQAMPN